MPNTYDKGDVVKLKVEFTDSDTGSLVDPTTVTAKTKDPAGVIANFIVAGGQIVKDAVGQYSLKVEPNVAGTWSVRWEGTGTNKGAEEYTFIVRPTEFD
jgi:hypothetical protein